MSTETLVFTCGVLAGFALGVCFTVFLIDPLGRWKKK